MRFARSRLCGPSAQIAPWALAFIGSLGLVASLATNVAAVVTFEKTSAQPLTPGWWSLWFPQQVVWASLVIAGVASLWSSGELKRQS